MKSTMRTYPTIVPVQAEYQYTQPTNGYPQSNKQYAQYIEPQAIPPPAYTETIPIRQPSITTQKPSHKDIDEKGYDETDRSTSLSSSVGSPSSEQEENEFIEKALDWTIRPTRLDSMQARDGLQKPVCIPTATPGMLGPFLRAWAPVLESHDVNITEFMEFVDHLNVVKSPSPILQGINLAGSIVGYVPNEWCMIAGLATGVVTGAAMYAVARIRIMKYLERANKEYFLARGLRARLAKKKTMAEITGEPETATRLETTEACGDKDASVRDRRLKALEGYIAPLQIDDLPPISQETNKLDQMASKMAQRKQNKEHKKGVKKREKDAKKGGSKEDRELEKELRKGEKELSKIHGKANKKLAKKPQESDKIEKERAKEVKKVEKEIAKAQKKCDKEKGKDKEEKAGNKFLWIVIENADAEEKREQEKNNASRMPR